MNKKLTKKAYWDNIYSNKNRSFHVNYRKYYSHFDLDRIFKKYLLPGSGKKILEIGCGGSKWLPYFQKEFGYEVYGIDYSKVGCEIARENLQKSGCSNKKIFCYNFLNFNKDLLGKFDVIFSLGVVEHFNNIEEIIKIFSVYLKKGGIILTEVPNPHGFIGKLAKFANIESYKMHNLFDLDELINFHKKAGLKCIYSSYFGFLNISRVNLSRFSIKTRKLISKLITLINISILWFFKITNLTLSSAKLCSSMIVIAVKKK